LYSDPDTLKKFPHFPILLKSNRDRQSASQGRKVRRRDPGHARRRVRRPARSAHSGGGA
jgi:hypothetical protein